YNKYVEVSKGLKVDFDKKTYRNYQMKLLKLKTKMNLRNIRNKSKKIAH
ncbi:glycosyltransferase family 2 protein, partial [Mammaliicoccus vitulinus]